MSLAQSFPPIIGTSPKILILGSSPGVISLKKQQYFAHPRNAFWPIMAELFGIDVSQGYDYSVAQCRKLPIVIWDSLKQCEREGSLDSAIKKESVKANDFAALFEQYPDIEYVFCNGGASFQWFNRLVLPSLSKPVLMTLLPSTSPAHAAMSFDEKLNQWERSLQNINSFNVKSS